MYLDGNAFRNLLFKEKKKTFNIFSAIAKIIWVRTHHCSQIALHNNLYHNQWQSGATYLKMMAYIKHYRYIEWETKQNFFMFLNFLFFNFFPHYIYVTERFDVTGVIRRWLPQIWVNELACSVWTTVRINKFCLLLYSKYLYGVVSMQ